MTKQNLYTVNKTMQLAYPSIGKNYNLTNSVGDF